MSNNLYFLFDTSGSMNELGKKAILNASHRLLKTKFLNDHNANFYFWADELSNSRVVHKPNFRGRLDPNILNEFLKKLPESSVVIILSDGLFPVKDIVTTLSYSHITVYPIAIGTDADLNALQKLSSFGRTYTVTDLAGLANRITHHSYEE